MQKMIMVSVLAVALSVNPSFVRAQVPVAQLKVTAKTGVTPVVNHQDDKVVPHAQMDSLYLQKFKSARGDAQQFKIGDAVTVHQKEEIKPKNSILGHEPVLDEKALRNIEILDPKARLDLLNEKVIPQISIDPSLDHSSQVNVDVAEGGSVLGVVREVDKDVSENYFLAISLQVELKDGAEYVAKENDFYIKVYERALDDVYDFSIKKEFYCDGEMGGDGRIDCAVEDLGFLSVSTKRYDVGIYVRGELVAQFIQYGFHKFKDGEIVPELLQEMPEQYETKCFLGDEILENNVSECESYSAGGFIFGLE